MYTCCVFFVVVVNDDVVIFVVVVNDDVVIFVVDAVKRVKFRW